jgi:type VI secretion system protein ImpJ
MHYLPVHWSEGLFLRPQHFQAADRYWTEIRQVSEQWDHQYDYGIRALELSDEAIANHQLQVNVCHARMRDGTLIFVGPGQELDRVDLTEAFAQESVVRVFLAVPKLKLGSANVAPAKAPGRSRYTEVVHVVQDESLGGNEQEVALRSLNVRVLLSTQDLAGYEVLPIAQIQRASERQAAPLVDPDYFPPMLACDAWPPLGRDIVRAIYDLIGKRIEVLTDQVTSRGIGFASQEPGDLDRILMLSELNVAYCTLGVLAFALGVHPLTAYTELCRIVGRLSVFAPERRAPQVPTYDHDDLARIFRWVKKQIELLLLALPPDEYEQRFFVGEGNGMRVTLESKWLNAEWQWFVGVARGTLTEKECTTLLSSAQLDWKLGSARQVDRLFENRAEGLRLTPLPQAPRALPRGRDWIYYDVSRGNAAWRDVLETQTLAMRLKDTLIVNREELPGQRKLVVSVGGKQAALQFALFAVPNRP